MEALLGQKIKTIYPDGNEVIYHYDLNNNLLEVMDINGATTTYLYDSMNRMVERHTENLPSEYYTYTLSGAIEEVHTEYLEGEMKHLLYQYDEVGNLTHYKKAEEIDEAGEILYLEEVLYEYNERNEMVKEIKRVSETTETTQYAYNIHGDRIEVSQGSLSKVYSYNSKGQLSEVIDYDGTIIQYEYDALGNRISESVQKPNQNALEMTFINNVNVQYPEVLTLYKNNSTFNFSYGVQRLAMNDVYYYYDGLGSVTQLIDTSNTIVQEYSYTVDGMRDLAYDPYIEDNMYGYRGEAHTADGLQYLRARYYDPKLGRFLMWDEYEGKKKRPKSKNRYIYGENNPNKYKDPSGRMSQAVNDGGGLNSKNFKEKRSSDGKYYLYYGNSLYSGMYKGYKYKNGLRVAPAKKTSSGNSSIPAPTPSPNHGSNPGSNNNPQPLSPIELYRMAIQGAIGQLDLSRYNESKGSRLDELMERLGPKRTHPLVGKEKEETTTNYGGVYGVDERIPNPNPKGDFDKLLQMLGDGIDEYSSRLPYVTVRGDKTFFVKLGDSTVDSANSFGLGTRYNTSTVDGDGFLKLNRFISNHKIDFKLAGHTWNVVNLIRNIGEDAKIDKDLGRTPAVTQINQILNLLEPLITYGLATGAIALAGATGLGAVALSIVAAVVVGNIIDGVQNELRKLNETIEKTMIETLDYYNDNIEFFKELEEQYGYDLKPFTDKRPKEYNPYHNTTAYNQPFI